MKICGGTNTIYVCGVELPKQGSDPIRKREMTCTDAEKPPAAKKHCCREWIRKGACHRRQCQFSHPDREKVKCKWGVRCTRRACPFGHPGTDASKTPKPSDVYKPNDVDPKPSDVDPKPSDVDPKPSDLDPKPSDVNPNCKAQ